MHNPPLAVYTTQYPDKLAAEFGKRHGLSEKQSGKLSGVISR